jgi:hypothetical protein
MQLLDRGVVFVSSLCCSEMLASMSLPVNNLSSLDALLLFNNILQWLVFISNWKRWSKYLWRILNWSHYYLFAIQYMCLLPSMRTEWNQKCFMLSWHGLSEMKHYLCLVVWKKVCVHFFCLNPCSSIRAFVFTVWCTLYLSLVTAFPFCSNEHVLSCFKKWCF